MDDQLYAQHEAFVKRLQGIDRDLWVEYDRLEGELYFDAQREALQHLVIGIRDDGCFPSIRDAISTESCNPVEIDECGHRHNARSARFFAKDAPLAADVMELLARAQLERDFGHEDRAAELMAAVEEKQAEMARVAS